MEKKTKHSNKHLAKSAGIIGAFTSLSRIFGFVRDVIIASFFGTGISAQAFVVAFRIPNLLRDLVGEGAANAAFVPVLSEYVANGEKKRFWVLVRTIFLGLSILLFILTIAGIVFAPAIVRLIAPGFVSDPEKLHLTVQLTRRIFPYIFLIGLAAFSTGVLHSLKDFFAPSMGPALLNITLITMVLLVSPHLELPVMALAIGVLIGGVLHVGIQVKPLYKNGFTLRGPVDLKEPGLKKIVVLLGPRILGSCIYQLSVFMATVLASLKYVVGDGGVAALYYSNRLVQLPLAVFAISLAQAALPTLSVHAVNGQMEDFKHTLMFSLKNVFIVAIPASVGLIVLSKPIVSTLFERGHFDAYSTAITSNALIYCSLGLFAYSGIKVLVNAFYSLQDTKTPVKVASVSLIINFVLAVILMWPLKIGGLALATSLAATFNFFMLLFALSKKIGALNFSEFSADVSKMLLASALMGIEGIVSTHFFQIWIPAQETLPRVVKLICIMGVSAVVLFSSSVLLGINEVKKVLRWIIRRG